MYPAFKINKAFEWDMLEIWLKKMAAQIWQNANLKKMRCQCALAHYVILWILLNTLPINMSDITAYL